MLRRVSEWLVPVCAGFVLAGCYFADPDAKKATLVSSTPALAPSASDDSGKSRPAKQPAKVTPSSAPSSAVSPSPSAPPAPAKTAADDKPRLTLAAVVAMMAGPAVSAGGGLDPEDLYGKAGAEVEALLGTPRLVRKEAPAEVWQYRSAQCVLDVVLYADDEFRSAVRYVEARARQLPVRKLPPADCLRTFAADPA